MKLRTLEELNLIDSELKTYSRDSWDFFGVLNTKEENYEYFNDIKDVSFDKSVHSNYLPYIIISCLSILLTVSLVILINISNILNLTDFEKLKGISNSNKAVKTEHIQGETVSEVDRVKVSDLAYTYCKLLSDGESPSILKVCCTESALAKEYNKAVKDIATGYDANDCYARGIRYFASYCNLENIVKITEQDNIYYCYINVSIPTEDSVYEYMSANQRDFAKHFSSIKTITDDEIIRYMLNYLEANPIPHTTRELCLQLTKSADGYFKICDDTEIKDCCSELYLECVNEVTKVLKNHL